MFWVILGHFGSFLVIFGHFWRRGSTTSEYIAAKRVCAKKKKLKSTQMKYVFPIIPCHFLVYPDSSTCFFSLSTLVFFVFGHFHQFYGH